MVFILFFVVPGALVISALGWPFGFTLGEDDDSVALSIFGSVALWLMLWAAI